MIDLFTLRMVWRSGRGKWKDTTNRLETTAVGGRAPLFVAEKAFCIIQDNVSKDNKVYFSA